MYQRLMTLALFLSLGLFAQETSLLHSFDTLDRLSVDKDYAKRQQISLVQEGQTEGKACLKIDITNGEDKKKNHYGGLRIHLPEPIDLEGKALLLDVKTTTTETAQGFYVRCHNKNTYKPSWSFLTWESPVKKEWTTVRVQRGYAEPRTLKWEPDFTDGKKADNVTTVLLHFGSGSSLFGKKQSYLVDNLRLVPAITPPPFPAQPAPQAAKKAPSLKNLPPAPFEGLIHPLDNLDGIKSSRISDKYHPTTMALVEDEGGKAVSISAPLVPDFERNQYHNIIVTFKEPLNLENSALAIDVRSDLPQDTKGFYVRVYNVGSSTPSWSFVTWTSPLKKEWTTFIFQRAINEQGLSFEPKVVDGKPLDHAGRIELIIGACPPVEKVGACFRNLRLAKPGISAHLADTYPKRLQETVLVKDGKPSSVILYPDSAAGLAAAQKVAEAIKTATGTDVPCKPGTLADSTPDCNAIMLGNMQSNPAMRLLYARKFSYADWYFPGAGKDGHYFLHVAHNPHGGNHNIVLAEASDDIGLEAAAKALAKHISTQPKGSSLVLPIIHELKPNAHIASRYRGYIAKKDDKYIANGIESGKDILKNGVHCSIAGQLSGLGLVYMMSNDPKVAKLYVELWKLYLHHSENTHDVFGIWGFDSDFPSVTVLSSWDLIEEEPSLTDEERIFVKNAMLKWMKDIVIPSCDGGHRGKVTHNHGTFPSLGALRCAVWLEANYPECIEAKAFLKRADAVFREQSRHPKPMEDCDGYQWLTLGHTLQYAMARPDDSIFTSGVAEKIADFCLQSMDNFTIQVPYGDTGTWLCWESEQVCLDIIALATGNEIARWAANAKRKSPYRKGNTPIGGFTQPPLEDAPVPTKYDGLMTWPVCEAFYDTFPPNKNTWCPLLENCVDKVTFREKLDKEAFYLLLDGISTGTHKHEDGNSIPRITQFGRIWLADNDYFKAPLKYHNSIAVLANGESGKVLPYVELLAAEEDDDYACVITAFRQYVKSDWRRALVWLKKQKAVLVLDVLTALQDAHYQFKMNWHGIGEPLLDEDGLLLTQRGPSMRIQIARGPRLSLLNDRELGNANWNGYPFAASIVRSMSALANVPLKAGESYTFATIFHGRKEGEEAPWKLAVLDGQNGVLLDDGNGPLAIALDSLKLNGLFTKEMKGAVNIASGKEFRKSYSERPSVQPVATKPGKPAAKYVPEWAAKEKTLALKCRPPQKEQAETAPLPAQSTLWKFAATTNTQYLTPNQQGIQTIPDFCTMFSSPEKPGSNVLTGGNNVPENLLDGNIFHAGQNTMYPVDETVVLTFKFNSSATLTNAHFAIWHSTTSSKKTSYLLEKAIVEASADGTFNDAVKVGEYVEERKLPNWGKPAICQIKVDDVQCKGVRLTFIPKKGSSIYLAEVALEGDSTMGRKEIPQQISSIASGKTNGKLFEAVGTQYGDLFILDANGTQIAKQNLSSRVNAMVCADLDKDGNDEIAVALENGVVTVLTPELKTVWSYSLDHYRVFPSANVIYTGELDGDGFPEVVVGGNNWRFYAFDRTGKFLWHYEAVHPSRSGAVADLDGDGLDEVICGTHYYTMPVLNGKGQRIWRTNFGPICWAIATGNFDGDKTRGIIAGSGNGFAYMMNSKGNRLMEFNTGEEVHSVLTADLDAGTPEADGKDEAIAGSYSQFIYAWNGDGSLRWSRDLGSPIMAVASTTTTQTFLHVGLRDGRLLTLNAKGEPLKTTNLGSSVNLLLRRPDTAQILATTEEGKLFLIEP